MRHYCNSLKFMYFGVMYFGKIDDKKNHLWLGQWTGS